MVDKPIFCAQAFGSICINASGKYVPCCNIRMDEWHKNYHDNSEYQTVIENANNKGLKKLRKELSEGIYPEVCKNCSEAEDNGYGSMRTIWNKALEEYEIPACETLVEENVYYLDTTFSTKCNSKCMTCNPSASDFWEKEYNYIWGESFIKPNRINIDQNTAEDLFNNYPNVVRISFVGGEPTISDEHLEYLKKLVDSGRSKSIKISYVTNLTGVTEELLDIWKNFREVGVSVSIDGFDKVNEYIRYPFKWNKVDTTLRNLLSMTQESVGNDTTEVGTGLSCTISLFNAIQCFDLFEYYFDLLTEYKVCDKTLASYCSIFVNYVTFPSFAMVNNLSTEYRQIGIDKGNKLLTKIQNYMETNENETINEGILNSIKLAIEWLKEPQQINNKHLKDSKHFISSSDRFRNRHLKDYIPELYEELEKLWNIKT